MKDPIQVRPNKARLINILDDISKGKIKIPKFQRKFVWQNKQMLDLFDSLEKGYPIGSLLFWKPENEFEYYSEIGGYSIDAESNSKNYILDGFQRLNTLFGVLANPDDYSFSTIKDKRFEIYYDLKNQEFTYYKTSCDNSILVPLYVLMDTFAFLGFVEKIKEEFQDEGKNKLYINRAKQLAKSLLDYEISYVEIDGGDIASAVNIFSRINSKGTEITPEWMISALTYNEKTNFILSKEFEKLAQELENYNFEELNQTTILHCIKSATGKSYYDVKIEELARRSEFETLARNTFKNIILAVRFLHDELNVIKYRLLPYDAQMIFITEFFRSCKEPTIEQIILLKRWFWFTSYSNYFTVYSVSKQVKALRKMQQFAINKVDNPIYLVDTKNKFTTAIFPEKLNYGSVRSKTLLLFMLENSKNFNTTSGNLLEIRYLDIRKKTFEGLVAFLGNEGDFKGSKKNDALPIFENYLDDISMKKIFFNNDIYSAIDRRELDYAYKLRKIEISNAEIEFVEDLNIEYNIE